MKLSEIKVGDKVRLRAGVEGTPEWHRHAVSYGVPKFNNREWTVCKLDPADESADVALGEADRCIRHWLRSEWLEPVEAEPPASAPPDAIGLRLGGFVAINRVTSIDLTADQLVELVATSFGSKPKAGTMSVGATREEGVLKTFNLRWQEQAPGGDS